MSDSEARSVSRWDRRLLGLRVWIWVMVAAMLPVAFTGTLGVLSRLWTEALLIAIGAGSIGATWLRRRP